MLVLPAPLLALLANFLYSQTSDLLPPEMDSNKKNISVQATDGMCFENRAPFSALILLLSKDYLKIFTCNKIGSFFETAHVVCG